MSEARVRKFRVDYVDGENAFVRAESFHYTEVRGALVNARFHIGNVVVAEFPREMVKGIYEVELSGEDLK